MVAYAIVLLTDMEDVHEACRIEVRYGTITHSICGETVRAFVRATNHTYHDYPNRNCLACGLEFVPPEMRPIFEYLYETLKETIVWTDPSTFE